MTAKRTARKPTSASRAASKRRRLRTHALSQVADYLRDNGFDNPEEHRTRDGYRVEFEELSVFAGVRTEGNDVAYLVGAEVMQMPSDADLVVPLMRELLEMNAMARGPARFCVDGDSVWVVVLDLVELMPDADFGRCIDAVLAWAGQSQEMLRKKYHRTTRKRR
jgi:hypothetical protein